MSLSNKTNQDFGANGNGDILYEDNECVVFDVEEDRQAPVHFKVVPKTASRLPNASVDERLLGHLLEVAKTLASDKGLVGAGHHLVMEQSTLHVFSRALHHMLWPVGPGIRL